MLSARRFCGSGHLGQHGGMSSRTGLKKADGQRLGPLMAAICGATTPTLHAAARRPWPLTRKALDLAFQTVGGDQRRGVTDRDMQTGSVSARLYTPDSAGADAPLLVFCHGGGFVLGSLDSHAQTCRLIGRHTACKVLAVGYRKAPEHPFPAALEDCVAAFRWAADHACELGVDPARIAVGGDSAGGNLAAGVCLQTARDPIRPCGAWLLYPFVDADIGGWPSGRIFAKGPLLSTPCAQDMLRQYTDNPREQLDQRISVIDADGLGGLPTTYLATAGMDPLRDQGEAFADRARAAGATVELRRFASTPHGFILLLVDREARQATLEACAALARLLAPKANDAQAAALAARASS